MFSKQNEHENGFKVFIQFFTYGFSALAKLQQTPVFVRVGDLPRAASGHGGTVAARWTCCRPKHSAAWCGGMIFPGWRAHSAVGEPQHRPAFAGSTRLVA